MSSLEYEHAWQPVIDDLEPGDTVRINHTNCEAGEDTRKRLYFSRPVGGGDRVLGYCHNCQKGASFFAEGDYRIDFEGTLATSVDISSTDEFKIPKMEAIRSEWPREARHWLFQYGISDAMITWAEIAYIPATHRMYLPIYEHIKLTDHDSFKGNYKGYQTRRLWTKGKRPKYDTSLIDAHQTMDTIMEYTPDDTIFGDYKSVIVEDFLSGLRILQFAKDNSFDVEILVNYGTKINVEAIAKLSGEIFVWFDNDNAHVCNQATKVARTASLILKKPAQTILEVSDPKAQSYETIGDKLWT